MKPRIPTVPFLSLVALLAILVAVQSTACTKAQRRDTLKATFASVNAARDGFHTWSLNHQKALVTASTTREEAEARVAAYREQQRAPILDGFEVAYQAIALAGINDDDVSFKAALAQVSKLLAAIKALTGGS